LTAKLQIFPYTCLFVFSNYSAYRFSLVPNWINTSNNRLVTTILLENNINFIGETTHGRKIMVREWCIPFCEKHLWIKIQAWETRIIEIPCSGFYL